MGQASHSCHNIRLSNAIGKQILSLFLTVLFSGSIILAHAEDADPRVTMANVMLNMMASMGFLGSQFGSNSYWQQNWNNTQSFTNPQATLPYNRMLSNLGPAIPNPMASNTNATLDGTWIGNGGERLVLQGNRFQLQATTGGQIGGIIQAQTDVLIFYQPGYNWVFRYQYALYGNQLALRDIHGQILIYRRWQ
ncbi:hypothetical protein TI04_09050 [Achromatium sp. WMS2]|nr:hypothetical protein TI04_09050 [Achromatium sp. WMS2]